MPGSKRKIVKIGPVSLAVVIPASFAQALNLKKGSEVTVDIVKNGDKAIVIRPIEDTRVA
jgi:antitoxin component of MazEF toxin-antitoxin module